MDAKFKAKLLASRLPTGLVQIEGVGELKVRGLSRDEVRQVFSDDEADDPRAREALVLSLGAGISLEEAAQWCTVASLDEINAVTAKVLELSGLGEGADKSSE